MKLFEDLSAQELLSSIICTEDMVSLYRLGLEKKNIFLVVCAQNELARRGDYDKMYDELSSYIKEGKMGLGSDFTYLIAENLLEHGSEDLRLADLGKNIKSAEEDEGSGKAFSMDDHQTKEFLNGNSLFRVLEWLSKEGCSQEDVDKMVKNYFANKNVLAFRRSEVIS